MRKMLKALLLIELFIKAIRIIPDIYEKDIFAIFVSVLAIVCIVVVFKSNKNTQILANKKVMWVFPVFYALYGFSFIIQPPLMLSNMRFLVVADSCFAVFRYLVIAFLWLDVFFGEKPFLPQKASKIVIIVIFSSMAVYNVAAIIYTNAALTLDFENTLKYLMIGVIDLTVKLAIAFYYCKLLIAHKKMLINDDTYKPSAPKPKLEPKWIAFKIATTIFMITYTFSHIRMFFVNPTAGAVVDILLIVNLAFIWINRDNINTLKVNLFLMILQIFIIAIQSVYILGFNIPLYEMGGSNALFLWAFFAFAVLLWLWLAGILKIKNINVIKYSALAVGVLYLGWTIFSMYITPDTYDQNTDTFLKTAFFTAVNVGYIFLITTCFDTTPKTEKLDTEDEEEL